jgi:hypothetical protein
VSSAAQLSVHEASEHLYEALTHHVGNLDLAANDPLVLAISEFGQRNREHDAEGIDRASRRVYEALTHHVGPRDLAANDPFVLALAEYGEACKREGTKQ